MNKGGADKTFVWRQKFKLTMHQSEKFFLERRLAQTWILAHRGDRLVYLLLEEMERDVFLAFEIVKDGAFSDAGLARNRFSHCSVEAFGLKEIQRGTHNALADGLLELRAPPGRPRGSLCARLCSRC